MTDFGFTGQRAERGMGLVDYNARFYAASVGRFVSADTVVPGAGNPMAWDRYGYVMGNPLNHVDPSGHRTCTAQQAATGDETCRQNIPTVVVVSGSNPEFGDLSTSLPGPKTEDQMPAWDSNPWGYDMVNVPYCDEAAGETTCSKYDQYQDLLEKDLGDPKVLACYSAGVEACLMYASEHSSVESVLLLGPTFSGADTPGGDDIGFEGWSEYMDKILQNGTDLIVYDDGAPDQFEALLYKFEVTNLEGVLSGTAYVYVVGWPHKHYDGPGRFNTGTNNDPRVRDFLFSLVDRFR